MTSPIALPPLGDPVDELWEVLLDLGERLSVPWALIGGQMVLLHALEHGTVPPQISQDGDVLADIRAAPDGLAQVVSELESLGFVSAGMSPEGVAHRYLRPGRSPKRPVVIDVLAPEGVGLRAKLTTTPPGRTVQVPGGTQALARTERVTVAVGARIGTVPCPTLLAAVVGKLRRAGCPKTCPVICETWPYSAHSSTTPSPPPESWTAPTGAGFASPPLLTIPIIPPGTSYPSSCAQKDGPPGTSSTTSRRTDQRGNLAFNATD